MSGHKRTKFCVESLFYGFVYFEFSFSRDFFELIEGLFYFVLGHKLRVEFDHGVSFEYDVPFVAVFLYNVSCIKGEFYVLF
ncbi:MAG: hypothetical protein ABI045_05795 [Flavobacteriales bacterium]